MTPFLFFIVIKTFLKIVKLSVFLRPFDTEILNSYFTVGILKHFVTSLRDAKRLKNCGEQPFKNYIEIRL